MNKVAVARHIKAVSKLLENAEDQAMIAYCIGQLEDLTNRLK